MNISKTNWTNNPSSRQVIFMTIGWAITLILIVLTLTDIFTEPLSLKKNSALCFLFIFSTWGVVRIYKNYYKHKKDVTHL
jgi:hypothetical protein